MRCYGFKCGTGTASRRIDARFGGFTVGVLVQANHGARNLLRIAGVPVGREVPQAPPSRAADLASGHDALGKQAPSSLSSPQMRRSCRTS